MTASPGDPIESAALEILKMLSEKLGLKPTGTNDGLRIVKNKDYIAYINPNDSETVIISKLSPESNQENKLK
jgi:hypothetical protein